MLILHFDYTSPSSAVAVLRLQRIADAGGTVRFSGIDTLGVDLAIPPTLDQLSELDAWRERAAELGLVLKRPRQRPPTLRAHVVGELAEVIGVGASWRSTCLRAYWTDGADLNDIEVLVGHAAGAGLGTAQVRAQLEDPRVVSAARQRGLAQHRRGVGGVPVLEADGTFVSAHLDESILRQLAAL